MTSELSDALAEFVRVMTVIVSIGAGLLFMGFFR